MTGYFEGKELPRNLTVKLIRKSVPTVARATDRAKNKNLLSLFPIARILQISITYDDTTSRYQGTTVPSSEGIFSKEVPKKGVD